MRQVVMASTLAWLAAWVAACSLPAPIWAIELRINDGSGPVAGARVLLDGQPAGHSDASGGARLRGQSARARARIDVRCPNGMRDPESRVVATDVAARAPLVLELRCTPRELTFPLVVHAPLCAGCPVRMGGLPLGQLNEQGVLHVPVRHAPGARVQVMIETTSQPALAPQNPLHALVLPSVVEVVAVAQSFVRASEPKPRSKQRLSTSRRPYAIRAGLTF